MTRHHLKFVTAAAAASAILACADMNGPTLPDLSKGPAGNPADAPGSGFIVCTPRPARADTFTVTSRGGSFKVDYAEVRFPKNVIAPGVTRVFEMRTPSASIHSVLFTPLDGHGPMIFAEAVDLRLKYDHCQMPRGKAPKIAYTTDGDDPVTGLPAVIENVPSQDDPLFGHVTGKAHHFSRYAVNY